MSRSKKKRKAADGLYHLQKYICTRPDGTRYYERFKGKSWDEVVVAASTFKAEYLAGLHPDAGHQKGKEPPQCPLTLLDAIDKYIDTCRTLQQSDGEYSVSTIASYMSIRNSIEKKPAFARIATKPIMELTIDDIQTALDNAAKPDANGKRPSSKTIRNWYGIIKPVVDKYGPDIRMDKIKVGKRKSEKTMVIHNASIPLVLRIAREIDEDFFLYILFIAVLGTRPSESYAFTWGDFSAEPMTAIADGVVQQYGTVNIDKASVRDEFGKYRIKGTKSESGTRTLSRHWSFFETLYSVRPRGADSEHIFSMQPNHLPYRWKKLKEKIDLPENMVMYDLRHYHGSVMAACGAPARYIADDMGHADISITEKHYIEEIHEKRQEINTKMFQHTQAMLDIFRGKGYNATENTTDVG